MDKDSKIFIAGHRGMVGSAVVRHLQQEGYNNLLLRTRAELDLCDWNAVQKFYMAERPDVVIMAAAKVGGIHANNSYPVEFLQDNITIAQNTIKGAYEAKVQRLLFLGSSCIYPRGATQPIREESLLTGSLEPTNEAYALAKIAGLKLCEYYRREFGVLYHSIMPTNLYGPGDNYDLENSHVLPAMIHKFHLAKERGDKEMVLWGSGTPQREFLHVDDLARGLLHVLNIENPPHWVNMGVGKDISIRELAELVKKVVGYQGVIRWESSMPDGMPRKLLDVSLATSMGWSAEIDLDEGVSRTYGDFLKEKAASLLRD